MSFELLAILALAIMFCAPAIKRVGTKQRLAIFRMGKLERIAGPGLVVVLPLIQTCKAIDIRDRSMSLPDVKLPGLKQSSIVSGKFQFQVDDPLKAATNADIDDATKKELQSTLLHVLSTATIRDCFVERHAVENRTKDLVNRQARAWGVKVTDISINDFPIHRKVIGQLMTLMSGPVPAELSLMIEHVAELNGIDHVLELNDNASENLEYKFGIHT